MGEGAGGRAFVARFLAVAGREAGRPAIVEGRSAIEDAIARYRPRPYDGAVCMLVSADRLALAPRTRWRRIYAGETAQFIVGEKHTEALDASTPRFAEALAKAMRRILAGLPPERRDGLVSSVRP